jgi:drug/metabolite transporter (DMT)-like permease
MTLAAPLPPPTLRRPAADPRRGAALLLGAAVVWSAGGLFARALAELDPWTVVFWRSVFAALFLAGFVAAREGARGLPAAFRAIGGPGLAVAACFAVASTAFVVALAHTTVANVLLVQAGVPLLAALLARLVLGERIAGPTWAAIAVTLVGVAVMVSPSLGGTASPVGDLLALTIAVAYATATVVTRRFARVRMTPAAGLGAALAGGFAATRAAGLYAAPGAGFAVTPAELALLAGFGALSFGLGLALFVTGARLLPAATAALIGVAETVLGPLWVWLAWGETPAARTLIGGGIVLAALVAHLAWTRAAAR